ncbi:MAG TPA: DUF1990 domain-containing protein [Rubrobacter sp.]|nr:DUF1990 domain-containing protein [Rubrobacter sp.]HYQ84124.1 DUF1990 domain-containing protein [Rubrobacter sp.]
MFLFDEPSPQRISRFLDAQRDAPFSYDEVGATRKDAETPTGFAVDHNRARLGRGRDAFERAVAALYSWKMFDVGWARLVPVEAPVEVGTTVAVLARHYGFHSLNPCRISYTIEEDEGDLVRRGFAYGTLPEHGERGEERFTVEWRSEDGSVFYDLYALSRPNHLLAWLGYPLARRLQRRFARDSQRAMVRATERKNPEA